MLRDHWREYAIEAVLLGLFMVSACTFATLLEHPSSALRQAVADPLVRRALMGLAMGSTAIALIYSPWGMRSGAHMNPAFTWTFFRLGRVSRRDAEFYTIAHFAGGIGGVLLTAAVLDGALADPAVHYVATRPGERGLAAAFAAELAITLILAFVVLETAASVRLMRYTGLFAGALVCAYIIVEAPLSGMSMNPARTFGSAFVARDYTALWLYFTAPLLGMLAGAQLYLVIRGRGRVPCAKLCHATSARCIFCEHTTSIGRPLAAPLSAPQPREPSLPGHRSCIVEHG